MNMASNLHLVGKNLTIMAATEDIVDEDALMAETKAVIQEERKGPGVSPDRIRQ